MEIFVDILFVIFFGFLIYGAYRFVYVPALREEHERVEEFKRHNRNIEEILEFICRK